MELTGIRTSCPIADGGTIVGYDKNGRLRRWNSGTNSEVLFKQAFVKPVRPAFSAELMVFGGDSCLVIVNHNKPTVVNLGLKLKSITVTPGGVIYFTADENKESRLYTVSTKGRVQMVDKVKAAEQVCFGGDRLYITDKWGLSSWNGVLERDCILLGTSTYVLCGGNKDAMVFLHGTGGLSQVGAPDGAG
ncbi:TPA: hypothetical protein DD449_01585 [Candidatus Berkelbacteria bacterium]|uniref:Uncharacterized protein n=1 Tax=Berkelbacteria bacterium GW2011_GWE1_39_12 TaxID=1618337 RepID=A0A0G4B3W7_9BACT|nr:MAG: hypothetical protein UT28_C0001G0769 [Berkelbacteria bacterium GW2011_GWE1_39_12]HBO60362.1 hypothetical protein [Candidatus Berkelbacteria bacterium]